MTISLRYLAAIIIDAVSRGQSLAEVLPAQLTKISSAKDRAFLQAICFGVCRFYPRLDFYLAQLLQKPLRAKESLIHALLLVGLYQLAEMRVPEHAAVAETVAAAEKLKKPWAKGLINAILREYIRRKADLHAAQQSDEQAQYAHPTWWIEKIKLAYPEKWQTLLLANNEQPPFVIRVNRTRISREDYLHLLTAAGIDASIMAQTEHGIILQEALPVEKLPKFAAGYVSIQDGAAQLAAPLLQLQTGQRVLDACAAPGGKLLHICELEPTLADVIAVEKDKARMQIIKENIARLQPQTRITLFNQDASKPDKWWDGKLFDRILLDAPCSASGVIRRHPDIKLLRVDSDIAKLAKAQLQLLQALWLLLIPGGILLYATCSIFEEENQEVIKQFLSTRADAQVNYEQHILPGENNMDGFYYARLIKGV